MSITRAILNKTDEKFEEIFENPEKVKHPNARAFACGAIEGFIDGAVFMYPILVGACVYWKKKALEK